MKTRLLALAALLAASAPALAAPERPVVRPTQDVRITYTASDPQAGNATLQVAISARGERMRVDMPGQEGALIFEPGAKRQIVLIPPLKSYIDMPADQFVMPQLAVPDDASFTRIGTSRIAGAVCTRWQVQSREAQGTVCLTDDGVLLAADGTRSGRRGSLEATKLERTRLADATFLPPADYRRISGPSSAPAR